MGYARGFDTVRGESVARVFARLFRGNDHRRDAILVGLWALLSDLPILAAIAAAVGAVMKPPFALVGAGFLVEEVREKRWRNAIKIAVVLGLLSGNSRRNFWIHRNASSNWAFRLSFQPFQLLDTLLGTREGLLLYAPWTIFGFYACARAPKI